MLRSRFPVCKSLKTVWTSLTNHQFPTQETVHRRARSAATPAATATTILLRWLNLDALGIGLTRGWSRRKTFWKNSVAKIQRSITRPDPLLGLTRKTWVAPPGAKMDVASGAT